MNAASGHKDPPVLFADLGSLASTVRDLTAAYREMWWAAPADPPVFEKTHPPNRQRELGRELMSFVDRLDAQISSFPSSEKDAWMESFTAEFREGAKRVFALSDLTIDAILQKGFADTTADFVDEVKRFDPSLSLENVYQALRNVWIMNTLQMYVKEPVRLTDAVFGYSLIYPYSDNFFDDPSFSGKDKAAMAFRLRSWLKGEAAVPQGVNETRIRDLIRRIESCLSRERFPAVYHSLLSIFNAQVRSLYQQKVLSPPYVADILGISVEKGGTSVLADGYLVKGALKREEEDFCFGFGFFLQLADDLQDVVEDRRNGHMTVFSQIADRFFLDEPVNKLFHLTDTVVREKLGRTPPEQGLKNLILDNTRLLLMEAVGKNPQLFSPAYYRKLETSFPVRFSFLKKFRRRVRRKLVENKTVALDLDFASAYLLTALSRTIS